MSAGGEKTCLFHPNFEVAKRYEGGEKGENQEIMAPVTKGKHLPYTAKLWKQVDEMVIDKIEWKDIGKKFNKRPFAIKRFYKNHKEDLRSRERTVSLLCFISFL